jgi:diguanylate cyclase (GGDEF)-like protein/PAS domain S-box-containing protein
MLADEPADRALDEAPCGLLVTDHDDVVTRVNATFLRWTGFTREQVIGRAFHDLLDTGGQAFYDSSFRDQLWSRGELREIVLQLVRSNGQPMPIMVNAQMVVEEGAPAGVRLAVFDVRNRQDFEREMLIAKRQAESSEASVRILQRAAERFLTATSEEELVDLVAEVAQDAFAASEVAVIRYLSDYEWEIVRGTHLRELLMSVRGTRASNHNLEADEVFAIADIEAAYDLSDELGDRFRKARAAAFSSVSITDESTVIGSFVCLYGRSRTFDSATLELHRALAKQMGLAFSRVRLQERLRDLASRDQVTGVATRAFIDAEAASILEAARLANANVSHIFIDLDGFKAINDNLGHRPGDMVLKMVADRIRGAVRGGDVVGRFGGDEFLVVCRDANADIAQLIAERIIAAVAAPMDGVPPTLAITASVGIAVFEPGTDLDTTSETLTRRADAAMYESKRAAGNRVTFAA